MRKFTLLENQQNTHSSNLHITFKRNYITVSLSKHYIYMKDRFIVSNIICSKEVVSE